MVWRPSHRPHRSQLLLPPVAAPVQQLTVWTMALLSVSFACLNEEIRSAFHAGTERPFDCCVLDLRRG